MWFKDVRQRLMIPGHKANQRKHGEDSCPNGNTDRKTSNTTPTVLAIRLLLGNKLSNLMEDPPGKELHAQIGRDEQSNKKILKSLMNRNPDPSAGRLWEEQLDHWSEGDVSPEEFARWAGAESIGWAARLLRRAGSSCRSSIDEGNASSNRSSYDYSASSFNTSDECPTSNVLPKLDLSLSHRWITGTPARNKSDSELVSSRRVHRKLPAVPDRNSVDDRHEKTQDATRRAASLPEALLASRSRRVDVEYLVNSEFWRPIQPAPPNTQEDKRRQATTLFGRHFQAERPSGCNAFALPPPPDEPEMPVVYSISESGNDFLRRSVGPLKITSTLVLDHTTQGWTLSTVCHYIFRKHNVLCDLNINDSVMYSYLCAIENGYPCDNAYHNRIHAADVVLRMYSLLRVGIDIPTVPSNRKASKTILKCILAAAVHDYQHPGTNNNFQMEFDSESARMYNYKSTLENHSVSHALALADEMRLFSKVPRNAAKDIKLAIIDLVLATDMAHHFDLVSSFSSLVCTQYQMEGATSRIDKGVTRGILNKRNSQAIETAPFRPLHSDFQRQPEGVRMLILKVALKLSDLGHCYLPWEDHSEWCKRLEAEFFAQGDTERSLGRKVSPLMDRELPGACDPANQNVFFKMFLLPMLELWVSLYPSCQPLLDQALANLNKRMASG